MYIMVVHHGEAPLLGAKMDMYIMDEYVYADYECQCMIEHALTRRVDTVGVCFFARGLAKVRPRELSGRL